MSRSVSPTSTPPSPTAPTPKTDDFPEQEPSRIPICDLIRNAEHASRRGEGHFPYFPTFPAEIRIETWKIAASSSNILDVEFNWDSERFRSKSLPALLSTCQESRSVALQEYDKEGIRKPTWYRRDRNVVHLKSGLLYQGWSGNVVPINTLAINWECYNRDYGSEGYEMPGFTIRCCFADLQLLIILIIDDMDVIDRWKEFGLAGNDAGQCWEFIQACTGPFEHVSPEDEHAKEILELIANDFDQAEFVIEDNEAFSVTMSKRPHVEIMRCRLSMDIS